MLLNESLWINKRLEEIPTPGKVLDIGSSTADYRENRQPYIDENIFRPLRQRGAKIKYLDLKPEKGVDIVADITDKNFSIAEEFDLVLCCSLLEHVAGPEAAIDNIASAVRRRGYLIVSIPYQYRYHADPIDNMKRCSPAELANLFPGLEMVSGGVISGKINIKNDLVSTYKAIKAKNLKALKHNARYCLFRPQSISLVLLKKL